MARILIIDDNDAVRTFLSRILESLGYTVGAAADGIEASALIRTDLFDAVLLDMVLPGKRGDELIRELREVAPETRIVAMSGGPLEMEAVAASGGGRDHCRALLKPFSISELQGILVELLGETSHSH